MKNAFYCEACGTEVKGHSDSCPGCGRSFLGIRCPRCGKEGGPEDFEIGCSICGYMAEKSPDEKNFTAKRPDSVKSSRASGGWPNWPSSRYWILSALIIIGLGLVLYFWLR